MSKPFGMWYCCAISNLCQISSLHYVKTVLNTSAIWHCFDISKLCQICQPALVSKICQIYLPLLCYIKTVSNLLSSSSCVKSMSNPFDCLAISKLCQISSSPYVNSMSNLSVIWHCFDISKLCQIWCQPVLVSKVCQIHLPCDIAWLYQNCVKFPGFLMSKVCQILLPFDTVLIYQNCVKFVVN